MAQIHIRQKEKPTRHGNGTMSIVENPGQEPSLGRASNIFVKGPANALISRFEPTATRRIRRKIASASAKRLKQDPSVRHRTRWIKTKSVGELSRHNLWPASERNRGWQGLPWASY